MDINRSLQNLAYLLIIIFAIGYISYHGSQIILPLIFAVFFSILLYPIEKFIYGRIKSKAISILLSFLAIILPFALIATILSFQFVEIVNGLPSIGDKLLQGLDTAVTKVIEWIPFNANKEQLLESIDLQKVMEGPVSWITQGLVSSSTFLVSAVLTIIFTFFFLYYRHNFKNFIIYQYQKAYENDIEDTLLEVKQTVKSYIVGLGIVILILSVLNSIGLLIIGINYAIFWGVLAALLAIIPFIGTTLGGTLPFLYALATADYTWQPIAVVIYYFILQQVEGNLITPKIVGSQVNVNPLVAIVALLFFGLIWGIAGVILALPMASIIKIFLAQFESTKGFSVMMGVDMSKEDNIFEKSND